MLTLSTLGLFLSALAAVFLLPGADMALVVATSAARGVRVALVTALGIACARALHVAMSGIGLAALMAAHPVLFDVVRWVGAAYLIFLAVQVMRSDGRLANDAGTQEAARASFARGFLTNLLNPKALLFCALFLPQFVSPAAGAMLLQYAVLGAILVAVGLAFDAVYAVLAARVAGRVKSGGGIKKWLLPGVFVVMAGRLIAS